MRVYTFLLLLSAAAGGFAAKGSWGAPRAKLSAAHNNRRGEQQAVASAAVAKLSGWSSKNALLTRAVRCRGGETAHPTARVGDQCWTNERLPVTAGMNAAAARGVGGGVVRGWGQLRRSADAKASSNEGELMRGDAHGDMMQLGESST